MNFWTDFLINFLEKLNSTGVTTVLAGLVAWLIYKSQKSDKKINAARIILSEIRSAERKIEDVNTLLTNALGDFPSVLPANSWNEYSYLFASDFDQDELQEISEFYSLCELIEDSVRKDNNFFWSTSEYRSQVVQEKLANIIESSLNKKTNKIDVKKLESLKRSLLDTFTNDYYMYSPMKTRTQLTANLKRIRKITTTTAGGKLKRIAKIK